MIRAVVTGPSRGIGRAVALELHRRNVGLVLVGRPSEALDEVARKIPGAQLVAGDLSDRDDVERVAEEVSKLGAPDVVFHNAAVIHRAQVEDLDPAAWDEQVAVNLTAPFLMTRTWLPAMKRAGRGRIVFVGSISSVVGTARSAAYNCTKWGLVGFMKSLAEELRDTGVTTLAVLPGSVDTRMLEGSGFEPRMTAEEVAATLVHFGLDAPAAHHGAIIEMFGT